MTELVVEHVQSGSRSFSAYHRLRVPRRGDSLRLGRQVGDGGFGELFVVERGASPGSEPATVVKIFDSSHPAERRRVARLIARLHRELDRSQERDWPRLVAGLPFAIIDGRLDGRECQVALMVDLAAQGYERWNLDDVEEMGRYQERSRLDRLEFAHGFAQAAALMESIAFRHADLNLENVMFRESDYEVQIIDFDGGSFGDGADGHLRLFGKRDDFVPPEAKRPDPSDPIDFELLTLEAERWSVGLMIGFLIFGIEPYHYCVLELSAAGLDAYARQSLRWPEPDPDGPGGLPENQQSVQECLARYEAAPGDTAECFVEFFAAGSDGSGRPTAARWVAAMEVARQPPRFEFLRVEPDVQVEGAEVVISWRAEGAESVRSRLFGTLASEGSERYVVGSTAKFELEAVNRYGAIADWTNSVRVVPLPRIRHVAIPDFPGLRTTLRIPGALSAPSPPPLPPLRLSRVANLPRPGAMTRVNHLPDSSLIPRLPSLGAFFSALWGELWSRRWR